MTSQLNTDNESQNQAGDSKPEKDATSSSHPKKRPSGHLDHAQMLEASIIGDSSLLEEVFGSESLLTSDETFDLDYPADSEGQSPDLRSQVEPLPDDSSPDLASGGEPLPEEQPLDEVLPADSASIDSPVDSSPNYPSPLDYSAVDTSPVDALPQEYSPDLASGVEALPEEQLTDEVLPDQALQDEVFPDPTAADDLEPEWPELSEQEAEPVADIDYSAEAEPDLIYHQQEESEQMAQTVGQDSEATSISEEYAGNAEVTLGQADLDAPAANSGEVESGAEETGELPQFEPQETLEEGQAEPPDFDPHHGAEYYQASLSQEYSPESSAYEDQSFTEASTAEPAYQQSDAVDSVSPVDLAPEEMTEPGAFHPGEEPGSIELAGADIGKVQEEESASLHDFSPVSSGESTPVDTAEPAGAAQSPAESAAEAVAEPVAGAEAQPGEDKIKRLIDATLSTMRSEKSDSVPSGQKDQAPKSFLTKVPEGLRPKSEEQAGKEPDKAKGKIVLNLEDSALEKAKKKQEKKTREMEVKAKKQAEKEAHAAASAQRMRQQQREKHSAAVTPLDSIVVRVKSFVRIHKIKVAAVAGVLIVGGAGIFFTMQAGAQSKLSEAKAFYKQNKFDKAEEALKQAVSLNSNLDEAHFYLGRVYFKNNDSEKALQEYALALAGQPRNPEYLDKHGAVCLALGKNKEAIDDYTLLCDVQQEGKQAHVYANLAAAYAATGQYNLAIDNYTSAIALNATDMQQYLDRGTAFQQLPIPKYDRALKDFDQAIKLAPKSSGSYLMRGFCYQLMKKYQLAFADFSKALSLNPKDPWVYNNFGGLERDQNKFNDAVKYYSEAIKLDSKFGAAYLQRAIVYASMKQTKLALADFAKAESLGSGGDPFFLHYSCAQLYESDKQYARAVEECTKALKERSDDYNGLLLRARCELAMGKYENCVADCKQALNKLKSSEVYLVMCRANTALKNSLTAMNNADEAVKHDMANPDAYYERGSMQLIAKNYASAAADFKQAIKYDKLSKLSSQTRHKLAICEDMLKKGAGPAHIVTETIQPSQVQEQAQTPKHDFDTCIRIARQCIQKRDFANAESALSQAVNQKPNDPGARRLLVVCYAQEGKAPDAETQVDSLKQLGQTEDKDQLLLGTAYINSSNPDRALFYLQPYNQNHPEDPDGQVALAKAYVRANHKDLALDIIRKGMNDYITVPRYYKQFQDLYAESLGRPASAPIGAPRQNSGGGRKFKPTEMGG